MLVALWVAFPIAAIIVLSTTRPLYEPRFLVLVLPAWAILVAAGITTIVRVATGWATSRSALPKATLAAVTAVALLGLLIVPTMRSLGSYYFDPVYARDDYRGLAQRVAGLERPGDAVVLTAPGQIEVFTYYYSGRAEIFPLPAQRPIDPVDTRRRLDAIANRHSRIWLVRWAAVEADPDDLIGRWFEGHARPSPLRERFGRVELRLYDLTATARRVLSPES